MPAAYRQEVFNVLLAQLLQERDVISAPEIFVKADESQARRIPDVIVTFRGLRLVIEGEVDDQPDAKSRAFSSAYKRVEEGIAHIAVAVVYPQDLRSIEFSRLKPELEKRELSINVVSEAAGETEFLKGDLDELKRALYDGFDRLTREDVVARATAELDAAVEKLAAVIGDKEGIIEKWADTLDIHELPKRDKQAEEELE